MGCTREYDQRKKSDLDGSSKALVNWLDDGCGMCLRSGVTRRRSLKHDEGETSEAMRREIIPLLLSGKA